MLNNIYIFFIFFKYIFHLIGAQFIKLKNIFKQIYIKILLSTKIHFDRINKDSFFLSE